MIKSLQETGSLPHAFDQILVQVQDVHKTYHVGEVDVRAVRGVDLSVDRGEFVAITGQSGSGKSTLMHIIGCLDQYDRGCYRLDGVDVTDLTKRELARLRNKKIGFVFQSFNLLSRTTVLDNVAMPLAYAGFKRRERRRQAMAMLERVSLQDRAVHHSNQLSGGQQQRVAIARALINQPVLLLADEPTGNLDSQTSEEIMHLFQELNRDAGLTILLVTHEPIIAQYAGRVVRMKDGLIESDISKSPTRLAKQSAINKSL